MHLSVLAEPTIVVGRGASPSTRHAAEELQTFLQEITGVTLPLLLDTDRLPESGFIVGINAHTETLKERGAEGLVLAKALDGLGDEGYVLQTVGPYLIIAGSDVRGTLYGVYDLLEEHYGCRWFTPTVSRIPRLDGLTIPTLSKRVVPILESREPFTAECRDGDWCARNRMNSSAAALEEKHGGKVRFGNGLFVHTFNVLMPPEEFFEEHPEYYSLIDGKRLKERTQLCCSNAEVIRICTERMLARIASDPEAFVYSLSQNDWLNWCECDHCTTIADREGSQMGPVLHLVNQVAEAVEWQHPDKAVETLAYQYTRKPPTHMRPRANVIIRLCSIECDFMQPLATSDDEDNRAFVRDLEGWSRVSERLWIWDYVTSFRSYLCPFPNLRVRDDNIRLFVANHVKGIFEQDVYNTLGGEFSALSGYLNAKLLWNPDYAEDLAIDEFLEGVYGAAAAPIRDYIDLLHDHVSDNNIHAGIWVSPRTAPFLNDALLTQASALWDKAEAAVQDVPETLERVQAARLPVEYAILDRANSSGLAGVSIDHATFTATIGPAIGERIRRFFRVAERAGVTRMDEGQTTLADYKKAYESTLKGETVHYEPEPAVAPGTVRPGLSFQYVEGTWARVPDFASLKPTALGVSPTISIDVRKRDEEYGLSFEGLIDAPRDGVYTFYTESNDGSRLTIDGKEVVDNDGLHQAETRAGIVAMKQGYHRIKVNYFQAGMRSALAVYWSGPGFEKAPIPAERLFHVSP
jgi:hypothetical protein